MDFENFKWKTAIAIPVILAATLFNWWWVWGLLFLFWTIPSIYSGVIHLVEDIYVDEDPMFFWAIAATWIALSLYMIAISFIPTA